MACSLAVAVCVLLPPRIVHADGPILPAALFDSYEHGQYDSVVNSLAAVQDAEQLATRLERGASDWVRTPEASAIPRRRLIVAAVALEGARVMRADWRVRRPLVEWACAWLRTMTPPVPAERWWHLAAISLIETASDVRFLIGSHREGFRVEYGDAWNHVAHAEARFPNEPRFRLAEAVAHEQAAGRLAYPIEQTPHSYGIRVIEAGPVGSVRADIDGDSTPLAETLRPAVRLLSALQATDAVAAEAHLRLGSIELNLDQPAEAVSHFEATERSTTDPFLLYLASLLRAASLNRMGRLADAEVSYRRALTILPYAQSATTGLAMLLFLDHRRIEASALVDETLIHPHKDDDPFFEYNFGDGRLWSRYIATLRASLQ